MELPTWQDKEAEGPNRSVTFRAVVLHPRWIWERSMFGPIGLSFQSHPYSETEPLV